MPRCLSSAHFALANGYFTRGDLEDKSTGSLSTMASLPVLFVRAMYYMYTYMYMYISMCRYTQIYAYLCLSSSFNRQLKVVFVSFSSYAPYCHTMKKNSAVCRRGSAHKSPLWFHFLLSVSAAALKAALLP